MKRTKSVVVTLDYSDIYRGHLILVNREYPVGAAVSRRSLVEVAPGVALEKQAALLYEAALRETGAAEQVVPVSGYRSGVEQQSLYAECLATHGEAYTSAYVALPGCSEHETGLAVDLAQKADSIDPITPAFPYTGICGRFRRAAVRHGFIQRYPEGREAITGIAHEPWHFRYVGIPHAGLIAQLGFTLEQYTQWIKAFRWGRAPFCYEADGQAFEIGYLPVGGKTTELSLLGGPYTVSGNNVDGFVVALWRCAP